ncbi:hypothetical protein [Streptosporangium sp. KLBMP 9127]|nr:hypothetical protein [Streptosporangium sp. KLBMP 9127]
MPTLEERVTRLEKEFAAFRGDPSLRVDQALVPVLSDLDLIKERLHNVERRVNEANIQIGLLRSQTSMLAGELHEGLATNRLELESLRTELRDQMALIERRIETLTRSNAEMFQTVLERLPAGAG